jgi:CelD/BcsL family acetyltransferase involved in cellulose biosynthesis
LALMRWKSGQYAELGTEDRFAVAWVVDLVERLYEVETPGFAGALSGLYAGDELVAAHFGMRAGRTWHYWFPAYEQRLGSYSPGLILLMEMARAGCSLGVDRIDLGPGDEPYKRHLMNGAIEVALGRADVLSPVSVLSRLGRGAKRAALALPGVGPGAQTLVRGARGRLGRGRDAGGW